MISLSGVSKKFGASEVVSKVTLTIKPGEIVGLLGPNGAGKTTTLRMIAGVLPPTRGEVTIDGKTFSEAEFELKTRIGYLPENNPLYDDLTVEEHLQFWADMKGLTGEARDEGIEFAVEHVGIAEVYYRLIGELSKGYRQRVGLAQAILSRPDILLLDEPTEGLDPNQRKEIQSLLSSLKKDRTVLVSSHVLGEISKLANRIVIIHKGKIVGDDSLEKLLASAGGRQAVLVEVDGRGVEKGLKGLKEVEAVEKLEKNKYVVSSKLNQDLRPKLFSLCVKKKWTLLTMQKLERQLEDVFSELTED